MSRTLFENALIINEGRSFEGWLLTEGDRIAAIGEGISPETVTADERVDCMGGWLLPGVIDTHVHFRDPGLTEKADMLTESAAAVAGGVTSYLDMPNTVPQTTSRKAWEDKMARAAEVSEANYGFFIGATNSNVDTLRDMDYSRVPGVKLFLGSSTGDMLVDVDDALRGLFSEINAVIAVHAEDEKIIAASRERLKAEYPDGIPVALHPDLRPREACVAATRRAIALAETYDARVHICHISTADELRLIAEAKARGVKVTAETCPQYLIWDRNDFLALGARIKCNPSIKDASDRIALVRALAVGGVIDTIATDHAPHLLRQKEGNALTAASGMPMVQFSLPTMLDLVEYDPEAAGLVSRERIVELMCHGPARVYGIKERGFLRPGYYADITIVKPVGLGTPKISDADVVSRCGWTPLAGRQLGYRVVETWVNGRKAFPQGHAEGCALEFAGIKQKQ